MNDQDSRFKILANVAFSDKLSVNQVDNEVFLTEKSSRLLSDQPTPLEHWYIRNYEFVLILEERG